MEETFESFDRVLKVVGVTIFAKENWESKPWRLYQILNFFIGLLCFIFTSVFVVKNCSDLVLFIDGACIWATGFIMTISLGVCMYFRVNFREYLEEMAFKDHMRQMPLILYVLEKDSGVKLMELKALVLDSQEMMFKHVRILLKMFFVCTWVCVTMYLCGTIYLMWVREDDSLRLLAFDMWFPWPLEDLKVYVASFIFHAYCGYLCCIAYTGFQFMIILLVGQVIRQLKILTFILLNLNELVLEITADDEIWQIYSSAVLGHCIDHYVKIKRFSNKLNIICQPFYLTLILDAIVLVCTCSVKIAISNKLSLDTMKYFLHETCMVVVVLMFCLLGQQVQNECEKLEDAVTEKWYIFNKGHKKNVLIFNITLSKHMPIYIFGSIPLSLSTFTWFIKTGMSFFTLVMSVLEEQ